MVSSSYVDESLLLRVRGFFSSALPARGMSMLLRLRCLLPSSVGEDEPQLTMMPGDSRSWSCGRKHVGSCLEVIKVTDLPDLSLMNERRYLHTDHTAAPAAVLTLVHGLVAAAQSIEAQDPPDTVPDQTHLSKNTTLCTLAHR